jgi:hypothetical protein
MHQSEERYLLYTISNFKRWMGSREVVTLFRHINNVYHLKYGQAEIISDSEYVALYETIQQQLRKIKASK